MSRPGLLLEVCVASVEDALTAAAHGADRLELNAALPLGGLTPSLGALIETRAAVRLPIVAMLRPRPGGFAYSDADFRVMQRDLDLLLAHGADGVAFGVLHHDGGLDVQRCRQLARQAGKAEVVFHRAFDVTPEPVVTLEKLIDLGFRRVLTSGQEETAYNGVGRIAELIRRARGRIVVVPAGGVNRFTVADVVARTGCTQAHASLRQRVGDTSVAARPQVAFAAALRWPEDRFDATSAEAVAGLVAALRGLAPSASEG
jgi:copper homeostasis protein